MTDEAIKMRREYYSKWRKEHPESVKRSNARYWEKKAAKKKASVSQ